MLRLVLLLVIIAGVAGYFTRPDEAAMRQGADAVLSDPSNLTEIATGVGAALAGDRQYDNYYVASKYTVSVGGDPAVQCWGYFKQVSCSRVQSQDASAPS